jgi:hypothetical protein
MNFAKLLAIASFALVACAASAQLIHEKPAGAEYHPEMSQEQVEGQQGMQGTIGSVGSTPRDTDDNYNAGPSNDSSANSVVASQATHEEVQMAEEEAAKKGGSSTFLVLMVVGGAGIVATIAYMVMKK